MAARRQQQGYELPFIFRIYDDAGNGIMYKAVEQLDDDTYMCVGTRIVGTHNGYTIWEFGGYMDAMPIASIHEIVHPRVLPRREAMHIIEEEELPDYLREYYWYFDDTSYWCMRMPSTHIGHRTRSRSSSSSNSNSKSKKKGKSKSKGKSRKAAGGGGSSGGW